MLTPAELVWLIAAVAKGDEAAFERLYVATRAKLFGVVLRIVRRQDLAEEVIQEAYVKIWNNAGQFNPGLSSPITWMASIARNRAIDVMRKLAVYEVARHQGLPDDTPRDHPKIYRADVVDVRNKTARFIAESLPAITTWLSALMLAR